MTINFHPPWTVSLPTPPPLHPRGAAQPSNLSSLQLELREILWFILGGKNPTFSRLAETKVLDGVFPFCFQLKEEVLTFWFSLGRAISLMQPRGSHTVEP